MSKELDFKHQRANVYLGIRGSKNSKVFVADLHFLDEKDKKHTIYAGGLCIRSLGFTLSDILKRHNLSQEFVCGLTYHLKAHEIESEEQPLLNVTPHQAYELKSYVETYFNR